MKILVEVNEFKMTETNITTTNQILNDRIYN